MAKSPLGADRLVGVGDRRAPAEADIWTNAELDDLLRPIEAEIHDRPNRVHHEMNQTITARPMVRRRR